MLNSCLYGRPRGAVLGPLFDIPGSDQENVHWGEVKLLPTEAPWQSPACYWSSTSPLAVLGLSWAQGLENFAQCMKHPRFSENTAFQPGFVSGMNKDPSV